MKHLERGSLFKNKLEGDWMDLLTFEAEQSDFLLAVEPDSNSLRLLIGARGDDGSTSALCGEPLCSALPKLLPKQRKPFCSSLNMKIYPVLISLLLLRHPHSSL